MMRLGLVTDVHNQDAELAKALELFCDRQVDQVVTLGDTCDAFAPAEGSDGVASLLSACGTIGVWGNHDFPFCHDVSEDYRRQFGSVTFDFMQQMRPYLEIDGCYFSHKDASVDPHDIEQLWDFDEGSRDLNARANAGFSANSMRRQFIGHYHCWWAATPAGPTDWDGSEPLLMRPEERYFIVVAGVFQSSCAVFDTETGVLEPLNYGRKQLSDYRLNVSARRCLVQTSESTDGEYAAAVVSDGKKTWRTPPVKVTNTSLGKTGLWFLQIGEQQEFGKFEVSTMTPDAGQHAPTGQYLAPDLPSPQDWVLVLERAEK